MIETICTPYGKAAFPTVVKCDGCGERLYDGWMPMDEERDEFGDLVAYVVDGSKHYCEDCSLAHLEGKREFRICDCCGAVMTQGYCDDNCDHICEECFEPWMDESCPGGWRVNGHAGDRHWDGGYYDERIDAEWVDTGIYWTQW